MPRTGSTYTLPAGSIVTDGVDDILASQHNTPLLDIAADLNAPRPIAAGGTGANSAASARAALGVAASSVQVTAGAGLTGGGDLTANREIALTGNALGLNDLATTGLVARTGSATFAARSITTISPGLDIGNASGASGNPSISFLEISQGVWDAGSVTAVYAISPKQLADALVARVPGIAGGVIASQSFTTASAVDIALPAGWAEIEIIMRITAASTGDSAIDLQVTRDAFSTVLNGASDYRWGFIYGIPGVNILSAASAADTKGRVVPTGGNAGLNTAPIGFLSVRALGYGQSGPRKDLIARASYLNAVGNLTEPLNGRVILTASDNTSAINGVRIAPSAGTITGIYTVLARGAVS